MIARPVACGSVLFDLPFNLHAGFFFTLSICYKLSFVFTLKCYQLVLMC